MKYGEEFHIGTLNTRGIKRHGKREEIEAWMTQNKVKILAIQETHVDKDTRET